MYYVFYLKFDFSMNCLGSDSLSHRPCFAVEDLFTRLKLKGR